MLAPGRRGAPRAAGTGACGDTARRARGRATSRYNLRCRQSSPAACRLAMPRRRCHTQTEVCIRPFAWDMILRCITSYIHYMYACMYYILTYMHTRIGTGGAHTVLQRQLRDWDSQPVSPALVRQLLGAGCDKCALRQTQDPGASRRELTSPMVTTYIHRQAEWTE